MDLVDDRFALKGALVNLTADESIAHNTWTSVPWDQAVYDTDAFWAASPNPERLTIPAGLTRVRLSANISFANNTTGIRGIRLFKNGGGFDGTISVTRDATSGTGNTDFNGNSAIVTVAQNDFFELQVFQDSGGALNLRTANATWLSIERIE